MKDRLMDEILEIKRKSGIVGREKELRQALATKLSGRHLLIEGEVGTGKTTLALAIAQHFDQPFYRVDGDERFTESKLVGYFDPPLVIEKGYNWDTFIKGPLTSAMLEGGILYLNEMNRLPEGTQNVLLPALDERRIVIPKLGEVEAKEGFMVIATENPAEHVGTTALSEALKDRFVWIGLNYQTEEEEREIVMLRSGVEEDVAEKAVAITRQTREDPNIRRGASVRGAIDLASIVTRLGHEKADNWIEASIMALSTKIELHDGLERGKRDIITEIVRATLEKDFF